MITPGMTALVVDDCSLMQNQLVLALRHINITDIESASDGSTALRLIAARPPELLLVDWNMPGMSGLDLVNRVRSRPGMIIIMVSGESSRERVVEAVEAGINGYILKPCTPDGLARKITEILERAAQPAKKNSANTESKQGRFTRALIIDDCALIHRQVEVALEKLRISDSRACLDGVAAIAELRTFEPHFVLLDWNMPGLDGLTTLKRMREDCPDLPIIMLTSEQGDNARSQAMEAGATAFLTKPFMPADLAVSLRTILYADRAQAA